MSKTKMAWFNPTFTCPMDKSLEAQQLIQRFYTMWNKMVKYTPSIGSDTPSSDSEPEALLAQGKSVVISKSTPKTPVTLTQKLSKTQRRRMRAKRQDERRRERSGALEDRQRRQDELTELKKEILVAQKVSAETRVKSDSEWYEIARVKRKLVVRRQAFSEEEDEVRAETLEYQRKNARAILAQNQVRGAQLETKIDWKRVDLSGTLLDPADPLYAPRRRARVNPTHDVTIVEIPALKSAIRSD